MKKSMDSGDRGKRKRSSDELDILVGVIDYAEKMIYEEGRGGEYNLLRRHAYGKTVVIKTENEGIQTFRLSSTPVVYPNRKSGYATPHSPVGRLCSFLQEGDKRESPRWGEYVVQEIRLFDRFDGALFEPNVRNFMRMEFRNGKESVSVDNLRSFLARNTEVLDEVVTESAEKPSAPTLPEDKSVGQEPTPEIQLTELNIVDAEEADEWQAEELEEGPEDTKSTAVPKHDYFGLSETFFLNRTQQQESIVSRSPIGAMYVEGVAGSGKTSAALGRTKMLCDYDAKAVYDEKEFKEIVGDAAEYWAGKFAGQFSQESSIGFVRTGELIQYLKETCRRLDLPNLPVQEYPELRSRLRQHRRVGRGSASGKRWSGLDISRDTTLDTTMGWFSAVDKAIANIWSNSLLDSIPESDDVTNQFSVKDQRRARGIVRLASDRLRGAVIEVCDDLKKTNTSTAFTLDKLASRIQHCINVVRREILGPNTLWVRIGGKYLSAKSERAMAQLLFDRSMSLYSQATTRLVLFDENGIVDETLKFGLPSGTPISNKEVTREAIIEQQLIVIDSAGETLRAVPTDVEDLYFRLLPESVERLYVRENDDLKPLKIQRGLGKVKLSIDTPKDPTSDETNKSDSGNANVKKGRSIDIAFDRAARSALYRPLFHVADAYSSALTEYPTLFPDTELAKQIAEQFEKRKLTDEDIDLLLCLYHIIGHDLDGRPHELGAPPKFQSVFIDEVQDFTEQQIYLMAEQARPEYFAVTAVGDMAQKLHNGSAIDIQKCFPGRKLQFVQLTKNIRQANVPGIAWFAAQFRAHMQSEDTGPAMIEAASQQETDHASVDRGPELVVYKNKTDLIDNTIELLNAALPNQTVAVVLPEIGLAKEFYDACKPHLVSNLIDAEFSDRIDLSRRHIRHFTSVSNAKGLEFDLVILPCIERFDLSDPAHQNRFYVALTRARQRLVMMGHTSRPPSVFDQIWEKYEVLSTNS